MRTSKNPFTMHTTSLAWKGNIKRVFECRWCVQDTSLGLKYISIGGSWEKKIGLRTCKYKVASMQPLIILVVFAGRRSFGIRAIIIKWHQINHNVWLYQTQGVGRRNGIISILVYGVKVQNPPLSRRKFLDI